MNEIEQRLYTLESIEAIRNLKARYFHACDRKDIAAVSDCFMNDKILIDYGKIGVFESREAFLAVFEDKACHRHIVDLHHGHNGQVSVESNGRATGIWDLAFQQIDTQANVITQLGGFYNDVYLCQEGEWFIAETRFMVTSTLVSRFDDKECKLIFAGAPA